MDKQFTSLRGFTLTVRPAVTSRPHKHAHRPRAAASDPSPSSPPLAALVAALEAGVTRAQRAFSPPPPGFPPGPPGDAALALLADPLAWLESSQAAYGDVVGLSLGGERAVLVTSPAAAKTVLIDSSEIFVKAGTAFFPGSSLTGNGLLVSDGDVWRRQRQLAAPAFRRAAVERYAASMAACTADALGRRATWRPGVVRDVYAEFNELTLRITLQALFGASDLDPAAAKEVTDSIRDAFEFFAARAATAFVIPEAVPTPDNVRFAAAVARLDAAVLGLIARRREELAAAAAGADGTVPTPGDLLTSLLVAKDDGGAGMDDTSLRDELMTLLVAGQETSAILLGWTCALLAGAPDVQAAAAAEVGRALGGRVPSPADAQPGKLPYLEAVVLEAMRVMPPAYMVGRCTAEATILAGYPLPEGTTVLVSPYMMHRDPRWWGPDVREFRPERWLEAGTGGGEAAEKGKSMAATALGGMGPNGAYIPFGAGPRVCIGAGFAMTEAVLVLAALLQRFELVRVPGSPPGLPPAEPRITLRPKEVRLALKRRRTAAADVNARVPKNGAESAPTAAPQAPAVAEL